MNKKYFIHAWPLMLASSSAIAADTNASQSPSLQGYTGALNVPSAYTAPHGHAVLQYSDAFIYDGRYEHNHNAIGNFGLLPNFEAGGKISWDTEHTNCYMEDCGIRDMSANLKWRLPFIPDEWFAIAIGVQDVGGAANYFSSEYVVASKQFRYARVDVGAGQADLPERYIDGAFGAVELQPWKWLGVIAEFDGQDANAGLRVGLPDNWQPWGIQPELKVMAYSDREEASDARFFSLSFGIPLGDPRAHYADRAAHKRKISPQHPAELNAPTATSETGAPTTHTTPAIVTAQTNPTHHNAAPERPINQQAQPYYEALADTLLADKFEHVLVGEQAGALYVAFENNQFNRNELDALALVLQRVSAHAKGLYPRAHVLLRNQKLATLEVIISPDNYQSFLHDDQGGTALQIDARYPEAGALGAVNWFVERSYGSTVKPRFTVSPGLVTGVATEYGLWDYSLSMQTDLAIDLWSGAMLAATYNMPIDQSEDFDRYVEDYNYQGVFYQDRQRPEFEEYELQQTLKIASGLFTTFHAGHYMRDYDGFFNQTAWFSPEGNHKVALRTGQFTHEDDRLLERDFNLLSYRYFFPSRDISIETTYGEFWQGDEGLRVDTRFWFGDTAVTLEYKDTDAQFVGMRWTVPLTPRRDWITPYGQLKGRENWAYGLQTRINEDSNFVSFGVATVPRARNEIERTYLNNDRLSPGYVRAHWKRLKEAASTFDR